MIIERLDQIYFMIFEVKLKKKITNLKPKEKLLIFNYTYNTYIFH